MRIIKVCVSDKFSVDKSFENPQSVQLPCITLRKHDIKLCNDLCSVKWGYI